MFEPALVSASSYSNGALASRGDGYAERMQRAYTEDRQYSLLKWMDSPAGITLHTTMLGHYLRELDRQAENREQMAMDEAFYDHLQWSEEELATLEARGQAPLVFNMIQTSVNWILGSQRRAPTDYKILPRTKEGSKVAEVKSELIKHLGDINGSEFEWADAFADAVKAGVGWMETGQGYQEDGAKVYDRREGWRAMLWDSTASRYDLQDARYMVRAKWLDADVGEALWPERAGFIRQIANDTRYGMADLDDMGDAAMDEREAAHFSATGIARAGVDAETSRPRFRAIEVWFKRFMPAANIIRGGQFNGEMLDPWSPGHYRELQTGRATLITRPKEVVHCALMTETGFLDIRESPYRHNRYPFTPIWGYRRASDGMPYGFVRGVRDIQRDMNKRASKALHHLSTTRVTVEEGAVPDIEELRDEAGRPDAVIVHKSGKQPPMITTDAAVASAHLELMSRDAAMIQSVGGVTDENMGRQTNAKSGKAIIARQDQGALATSIFFDNLRRSKMDHGEKLVINIEQFYTDQDEFRITDARGNAKFVQINGGGEETAIAAFKADFVITEDDWRATVRQAQAEQLLDLFTKLAATAPQIVMGSLDLIIEALDVPKRDEFVKRIRQMTGIKDPDADPNNPSPEDAAADAAKAKADALAERAAMAELTTVEARAEQEKAKTLQMFMSLSADEIAKIQSALNAAATMAQAPALAPAADAIMKHADAASQAALAAQGAPAAPEQAPALAMPQMPAAATQPPIDPATQGAIQ